MNHELLLNLIRDIQLSYAEQNKKVVIEVYIDHPSFRGMIEHFSKNYGSIVPYGIDVSFIEFNGAHIYREDLYHDYLKIEVKGEIDYDNGKHSVPNGTLLGNTMYCTV